MNDKTVRLVFIGSGDFSIPVFRSLFALTKTDSSFAITGIVTQPDRPAGRGRVLTPSPLRKALSEDPATNGIPVLTPKKLAAEADEVLSQFAPDLIVTVDYGQIVPFALLTKPKYRCLNIHPSLLPTLRGATPIPSAILNGSRETGVTIQIMAEALDAGDILEQKTVAIEPNDTAFSLEEKLMQVAAGMVADTVKAYIEGTITPVPQEEALATFCYEKDFNADKSCLDWDQTAIACERRVRSSYKKPLAWTTFRGKRVKIHRAIAAVPLLGVSLAPGELYPSSGKLFVGTRDGWLQVTTLQSEGKNPSSAADFINGLHIGEEEYFVDLLLEDEQSGQSTKPASRDKAAGTHRFIDHPIYLLSEFVAFFLFSGFLALQPADPLRGLLLYLPLVAYSLWILQRRRTMNEVFDIRTQKNLPQLQVYLVPTLLISMVTLSLYPLSANISVLSWLTSETWSISRPAVFIYLIALAPLKALLFQTFALRRSRQLGLHIVNAVIFNALLFGLAHVLLGSSYLSLSALLCGLILAATASARPSLIGLTLSQIIWGLCIIITIG